jgi:hypothetical protein
LNAVMQKQERHTPNNTRSLNGLARSAHRRSKSPVAVAAP